MNFLNRDFFITLAFELLIFIVIVIPTVYVLWTGAPFIPSRMEQVQRILSAARLKPGMIFYDLGSGDGRLVHEAVKKYQVRGIGYEYAPLVFLWAKIKSWWAKAPGELRFGDFWRKDLSDADVITVYLLPAAMARIKDTLWTDVKEGALLVSHAFPLPGVKPWKKLPRLKEKKLSTVWVYKKGAEEQFAETKS